MTAVLEASCITRIGETAGDIFRYLESEGPTSLTKLVKEIDAPRDVVMQAIGWLGREDKIEIEEEARSRIVSLQ